MNQLRNKQMVAPKVCNKEKETASSEIKGKKYRNTPGKNLQRYRMGRHNQRI